MLTPKASNQLDDSIVLVKQYAAIKWCRIAFERAKSYGGKPWHYCLMLHDAGARKMSPVGLTARYGEK